MSTSCTRRRHSERWPTIEDNTQTPDYWEKAKDHPTFFRYWAPEEAHDIAETAFGKDSLWYTPNDRKIVSLWAAIAALNKRLTHAERDTQTGQDAEVDALAERIEQLEEQIDALEQWKPRNTREHIIHLLTTTEKTQREIADDLEVSESWVSRVKNGL